MEVFSDIVCDNATTITVGHAGDRSASQSMEPDPSSFDNAQQFWHELSGIVSVNCTTHEQIDDTLRRYLAIAAEHKGKPNRACPTLF